MSTPSGRRANVRSRLLAGIQKHDSLSKFFDSVLDGTADLTTLNAQAADEEFVPDEKDLEIERMQEAQRIALAHGGFTDLIDFEEAIKNGAGADFHEKNGYPGMMGGGMPKKKAKADDKDAGAGGEKEEDMLRKILKASQEAERKEREKPKMAKTDEAGQVVFKAEETGHPKTPVAGESASTAEATPNVEKREEEPAVEEVSPDLEVETPAVTSDSAPEPAAATEDVEAKSAGHPTDEL